MKILFNNNDEISFVFKNKEGREAIATLTVEKIMQSIEEIAFENLIEPECCESSCSVNGYCECGNIYEDYEFVNMQIEIT